MAFRAALAASVLVSVAFAAAALSAASALAVLMSPVLVSDLELSALAGLPAGLVAGVLAAAAWASGAWSSSAAGVAGGLFWAAAALVSWVSPVAAISSASALSSLAAAIAAPGWAACWICGFTGWGAAAWSWVAVTSVSWAASSGLAVLSSLLSDLSVFAVRTGLACAWVDVSALLSVFADGLSSSFLSSCASLCAVLAASLGAASCTRIAKGDAASALLVSGLFCAACRWAEEIRDVADARTNGNPIMIRQNPSQAPGQMQARDFVGLFGRQGHGESMKGRAGPAGAANSAAPHRPPEQCKNPAKPGKNHPS